MILADTCVLLDVVQADSRWVDWSSQQLAYAAVHGGIADNPVIYAEFSVWYDRMDQANDALAAFGARFENIPRAALFLAGKAFAQYRQRRGRRTGVLPDFFIGAHAAVGELPLLTRDVRRFRSYFPTVPLLTPDTR